MSESPRMFVVHALTAFLTPVTRAFSNRWSEAQVCNLMDDALSRDRQSGRYAEDVFERRLSNLFSTVSPAEPKASFSPAPHSTAQPNLPGLLGARRERV